MAGFSDVAKALTVSIIVFLLNKLAYYVVSDAYSLFKRYSCGQWWSLMFSGSLSTWGSVGFGVPQGLIIGPIIIWKWFSNCCDSKKMVHGAGIYMSDYSNVVFGKDADVRTWLAFI